MNAKDSCTRKELLPGGILRAIRTGWDTLKYEEGVSVQMRISPTGVEGEFRIETCPLALLGRLSTRGRGKQKHFVWWNNQKEEVISIALDQLNRQNGFSECWLKSYFSCVISTSDNKHILKKGAKFP